MAKERVRYRGNARGGGGLKMHTRMRDRVQLKSQCDLFREIRVIGILQHQIYDWLLRSRTKHRSMCKITGETLKERGAGQNRVQMITLV